VEMKRIHKIYENKKENIIFLGCDCQYIHSGHTYQFEIEEEWPLHSFYLRIKNDSWNAFKNAVLTLKGRKNDQSEWKNFKVTQKNFDIRFSSNLVLTNYSRSSKNHWKDFLFTSNYRFEICKIVLLAYHDECGHPEVPLHGNVAFNPGDTEAIYWCDDGYQLSAPYDIRHCVRGKWNGSQPICEFH
jgi:Sushi repeat (SCR repeat)